MKLKENKNGKKLYLFAHITLRVWGAFNNASKAGLNKTQGFNSRSTREFKRPADVSAYKQNF